MKFTKNLVVHPLFGQIFLYLKPANNYSLLNHSVLTCSGVPKDILQSSEPLPRLNVYLGIVSCTNCLVQLLTVNARLIRHFLSVCHIPARLRPQGDNNN